MRLPHSIPARDLLLLPCISLLTLCALFIGSEVLARHFFFSYEKDSCIVSNPKIGYSFRPNCTSHIKLPEGPWITYSYNECGYRTRETCLRKPDNSIRIALLGSSASKGEYVDYDRTFAARTAAELTGKCHRPVEVQNLGRRACSPACTFHRIDKALALHPDILVMSISAYDLEIMQPAQVADRYRPVAATQTSQPGDNSGLVRRLQKMIKSSSSVVASEHFLFQDPATYLKMYLVYGDNADYLRQPLSAKWQQRLDDFSLILGEMAAKAHAANVPFYLVEVPSLAQASLLSLQIPPASVDAREFNRKLAQISEMHGVRFVDVLDNFQKTPGANTFYYMVDGHLDADGEALISRPLVDNLLATAPALTSCGAELETASTSKPAQGN